MSSSATPVKISIKPRHPQFDLRAALASDWHSSDPFKTAFFNALSLTFPVGEKFFIDSVRAFEHRIDDPKLAKVKTRLAASLPKEVMPIREVPKDSPFHRRR